MADMWSMRILTDTSSAKAFAVYFFYEDFVGPVKPVIYFQTH